MSGASSAPGVLGSGVSDCSLCHGTGLRGIGDDAEPCGLCQGSPPEPYYADDAVTIYHGDSREILPQLGSCADVLLTDPPYSLSIAGTAHENRKGKGTRNLDFFAGDDDWHGMTNAVVDVLRLSLTDRVRSAYVWCGHRQFGPIVDHFESDG